MAKYLVNDLVVVCVESKRLPNQYRYPGQIISQKEYNSMDKMYKKACVKVKRTPKELKLYNLELHQWDEKTKTSRHISTEMWNSPYQLCKWKMEELKNTTNRWMSTHPKFSTPIDKGFYYKLVPNKPSSK